MVNQSATHYSNPPDGRVGRIQSKEFFNLAIRIAVIREGLTLTDTAFRAGIPRTSFYDRLHGVKSWSIDQLSRIGDVLFDNGFYDLVDAAEEEAKRVGVEI
jgi:predicted transcriptional regulator